MEDDWRVGKIASYLEHFVPGQKLCAIRIYKECLYPDTSTGPKPYESREIGQIMAKMDGWEKCKTRFYDEKYGQQRGWVKKENATVSNVDELPF